MSEGINKQERAKRRSGLWIGLAVGPALLVGLITLGGCSNNSASSNATPGSGTVATGAPAKTAVAAEFSTACNADNDKKVIEVSGYLDGDDGVECSEIGGGGENCRYRLKENPTDKKGIKADIKEGSSANEAEKLPLGYERKDIKIHASDGNVINLADKVKLTGEMSVGLGEGNCVMKATKIEKQ